MTRFASRSGALSLAVFAAAALVAGCAGFGQDQRPDRPDVDILQRSAYCHTPGEEAAAHYFPDPPSFRRWIDSREISEFRAGAASLGGVIVVEMGERPTAGYRLEVREGMSRIEEGTLILALDWLPPAPDAMVAQVVTAPCIVVGAPDGDYGRIEVRDNTLDLRAITER